MTGPESILHSEDLAAFVSVVDAGSVTGAARATGVPKSTLVRRLSRLEEGLGVRLLTRTARQAHVSAVGLEALPRVRALLADAEDLRSVLLGRGAAPSGRLRVSAPADLAYEEELWLDFAERYPQVELHLDLTNRYVNVVHEGFDVALRGRRGDDERLVAQRLGELHMVAVAHPDWVAEHGVLTERGDLMSVECFLLKAFVSDTPQSPRARHRVCNQLSIVRAAALRGLGVSILPWRLIREDLEAGRLVTVLADFAPLTVPMFAVYPDRRLLPASTQALLAHLRDTFATWSRPDLRPYRA